MWELISLHNSDVIAFESIEVKHNITLYIPSPGVS